MPKVYDYGLDGLEDVLGRLNKKIDGINNKSREGILESGLLVERESKKKTPVETSFLKGSTYTNPLETPKGPGVEIGYTAQYAVHVHERCELNHPTGECKFLEKALKENINNIIALIQGKVEV